MVRVAIDGILSIAYAMMMLLPKLHDLFQCRRYRAMVVSCTCTDGTTWPPAPCNDGSHDIVSCGANEETGVFECKCADGTVYEVQRGRGRGRGRGGRGGNGGGNGGEEEGNGDEEGEEGNSRGRG